MQRLGAEALSRLESRLVAYGRSNVQELLQVCAATVAHVQQEQATKQPPQNTHQAPWSVDTTCSHPSLPCPSRKALESWEVQMVQYGQTSLGSLEERLAAAGRHNLQVRGGRRGGACAQQAPLVSPCSEEGHLHLSAATCTVTARQACVAQFLSLCRRGVVQELMHVVDSLRAVGQSGWQELSGAVDSAADRIRCDTAAPSPSLCCPVLPCPR